VLGIAAVVGGIVLFRSIDILLLVIAAIGYTISMVLEACITSPWLTRHIVLVDFIDRGGRFAAVCFAVGFVWFAIRARRTI
jgi:hypothetical protein